MNNATRDEYVTKYYGCVERVARRMARRLPSHLDLDDLISAGALGLIEAAERFDPSRCDRFESFAEIRIRGAILDDLRTRDTLSRDMRRVANELRVASAKLANQLGRTPTEGDVATHLGVPIEEVYARRQKLSGSAVIGLEDADPAFADHAASEEAESPHDLVARRELHGRLADAIGALPERMQQILALYYMEGLSLRDIGAVLEVTESRVCQIHGEATRRLRASLGDSFADELAA
jgi:RNA polymerase sigma factor for flagellar operon FliA